MPYLYLACFLAGILLGVRLLFFGAERRKVRPDAIPLRRSEPAAIAFLAMFGLAGYLIHRAHDYSPWVTVVAAATLAFVWAFVVTRVAIATARIRPELDPDDPRFALQGCVAVVTAEISPNHDGEIRYTERNVERTVPARNIGTETIHAGEEVCIERIDDGVAHVERWALVERRL